MENRYKISYDMKTRSVFNIKFKQGDIDSSVLEVSLLDGSLPVNITGEAIEFRFLKSDKTIVYQDSTTGVSIIDAATGKIQCILKSDTLSAGGLVTCEIHRSLSGKGLTTPSFYFTVEIAIGEGGFLSGNYISSIENKIIEWQNTFNANEAARNVEFEAIKTEYNTYKNVMIAESNVAELQSQINVHTSDLAEMSSINKWSGDIVTALSQSDYIYIPKSTIVTITAPLTKSNLNGKKIRGEGETSVIKVVGNISAFDLSECVNSVLYNFTIEIETTNTSEIIKLGSANNTAQTLKNSVDNIVINCPNDEQGNYKGVVLYSDGQGVWNNNVSNIKIINPQDGVLVHAEKKVDKGVAWLTTNTIKNVYVRGMKGQGFEIKQTTISPTGNGETQVSQNVYDNITVQDVYIAETTRKAFVIGGSADCYFGLKSFADSGTGTLIGLEFGLPKGSFVGQNYILGGMIEGLIANEQYRDMNVVDFYSFSVSNSLDTAPKKQRYTNNYNNVLRNSKYTENINYWNQSGADTMVVSADTLAQFGRSLKLNRATNGAITLYQNVANRSAYAGKKGTYIACVKVTNSPSITILVDEGTPGNTSTSFNTTGNYQVIRVDRDIVGTGEALNCQLSATGTNVEIDVAWTIFSTNGYCRSENYIPATGGLGIFSNNGNATVATGSTSIVVNHGLSVAPLATKVKIVPTNSMGNATKFWVSGITATQFTINTNVDPVTTGATFAWSVDE